MVLPEGLVGGTDLPDVAEEAAGVYLLQELFLLEVAQARQEQLHACMGVMRDKRELSIV